MKCKECNCILSPEEEGEVLQAIAEGIRPSAPVCEDCRDFISSEHDEDSEDTN